MVLNIVILSTPIMCIVLVIINIPEAVFTVVLAPDDGCQHPKHVERLQKCNKLNKSHLVGNS